MYGHQLWVRNLELKYLDDAAENEFVRMLTLQAAEVAHPDDLPLI